MSDKEGHRHAAALARLKERKDELEDALGALARDEAEAEQVARLAQEVEQLEAEVEAARAATATQSAAKQENTMTKTDTPADIRKAAERNLDDLARSIRKDGETHEQAYARALDTELGKSMLATLDDATELERGGPTSATLAKARSELGG